MDVITQDRVVVDGVYDFFDEITRVRGGEAYTPDAIDLAHGTQQTCEIPAGGRRIAIAVDVLAEELDFEITLLRQIARFFQHAVARAAALRAACKRNHAIRAGFVAAFDDGD